MKILFMCVANSARSQIAEAMAKKIFGEKAEIFSAGSKPTKLNPFAARVIEEAGGDFGALYSKSVDDLPKEYISHLDYIITLCAEEVCPILISKAKKLHWPLPDPAGHEGYEEEQILRFRNTRDEIHRRLENFSKEIFS